MNEVSTFISSVGFPIAMCCGFAYVLWTMWKSIRATCETLTHTNEELVKTNSILASKIENKIDIVIEKLDNKEV